MKNWSMMLQEIGFMKSEQEDHFMQGFHRVFSRGVFTKDDAALLLGVARQAIWAKRNSLQNPKSE
jgi:tRNA C32,U32 (ribose-2'-O)-methylase TrmJ